MGVGKESIAIQLQNFVSGTLIFVVFSFNLSRMFFWGGLYFFSNGPGLLSGHCVTQPYNPL